MKSKPLAWWQIALIVVGVLAVYVIMGLRDATELMPIRTDSRFNTENLKAGDGKAGGQMLVAYDETEGRYTEEFIPKHSLAEDPDSVGAILKFKTTYVEKSGLYRSQSGTVLEYDFECESIAFTLVDRCTGEVIAETSYTMDLPSSTEREGGSVRFDRKLLSEDIEAWLEEVWIPG